MTWVRKGMAPRTGWKSRPRRSRQISWAAHDWAGRPWADEWQPITFLKRQKGGEGDGLYERARAMEAAKYTVERVLAQEGRRGERHSPRLAGDGEKEG